MALLGHAVGGDRLVEGQAETGAGPYARLAHDVPVEVRLVRRVASIAPRTCSRLRSASVEEPLELRGTRRRVHWLTASHGGSQTASTSAGTDAERLPVEAGDLVAVDVEEPLGPVNGSSSARVQLALIRCRTFRLGGTPVATTRSCLVVGCR